jgi:hypothetical protein
LKTPTKLTAITAAVAVAVPVGVAQATHDEGREVRAFRNQNPKPSNAAIKAMRKAQHAAYKECIKEAAEARTEDQ